MCSKRAGQYSGNSSVLHIESIMNLSRDATEDDHLPSPSPSIVLLFVPPYFHLRCLQLFMDNRCLKSRRTQRKGKRVENRGMTKNRRAAVEKPNDSLILLKLRPHKSSRNNNNSGKKRNKPQGSSQRKKATKKGEEKQRKAGKSEEIDDDG